MRRIDYNLVKLLAAVMVMVVLSLLFCTDDGRFFNFGFPLVWLQYFHKGSTQPIDLLKLSKYIIRLEWLCVDIVLPFIAIVNLPRLFTKIHKKCKDSNQKNEQI